MDESEILLEFFGSKNQKKRKQTKEETQSKHHSKSEKTEIKPPIKPQTKKETLNLDIDIDIDKIPMIEYNSQSNLNDNLFDKKQESPDCIIEFSCTNGITQLYCHRYKISKRGVFGEFLSKGSWKRMSFKEPEEIFYVLKINFPFQIHFANLIMDCIYNNVLKKSYELLDWKTILDCSHWLKCFWFTPIAFKIVGFIILSNYEKSQNASHFLRDISYFKPPHSHCSIYRNFFATVKRLLCSCFFLHKKTLKSKQEEELFKEIFQNKKLFKNDDLIRLSLSLGSRGGDPIISFTKTIQIENLGIDIILRITVKQLECVASLITIQIENIRDSLLSTKPTYAIKYSLEIFSFDCCEEDIYFKGELNDKSSITISYLLMRGKFIFEEAKDVAIFTLHSFKK